jgi:ribosomal protein S18 acetylase RimI-like enzyme
MPPGFDEPRLLRPDDYLDLCRFFERNNVDSVTRYFKPFPLTSETAARICLEEHKDAYFALWREGTLVALYMLRGWDEGFAIPSFGVMIDKDWQSRGLGRWMTEAAIREARHRGSGSLRLTVVAANVRAHALYRALGFEETSREVRSSAEIIVMHKKL